METKIIKQVTFCEDIWNEIKTNFIKPKPTCCEREYCNAPKKIQPLHSFPKFIYQHKFITGDGSELTGGRDNQPYHNIGDCSIYSSNTYGPLADKLLTTKLESTQETQIKYYCSSCFAYEIDNNRGCGYIPEKDTFKGKVKQYLRQQNPDWDENKVSVKTSEEIDWVKGHKKVKGVEQETPLFTKHKLKRFQEKITKYEQLAVETIKITHLKKIAENSQFIIKQQEKLEENQRNIRRNRARDIVTPLFTEMILRKASKLYTARQINNDVFIWITSCVQRRHTSEPPTSWDNIAVSFENAQKGMSYNHNKITSTKLMVLPPLV